MAGNLGMNTITGVDMKVYFGFREIDLKVASTDARTNKELATSFKWVDAGTVIEIAYSTERNASPQYRLGTGMDPAALNRGIGITQGQIVFKNFDQDSFYYLFEKVAGIMSDDGYLRDYNTNAPNEFVGESGFKTITSIPDGETNVNDIWKGKISDWDQFPFFDIMIVSKSTEFDSSKILSKMLIKDVKVVSVGSSEDVNSTEINDVVKFLAVTGIEPFKEFDGNGGVV